MLLNQDVQQKAYEEIERVTSGERLPTYDDLDRLPYVNAIYKETLRCGWLQMF